jgi:pimeloyl-ACP methyl ester carboxylesterase
VARVVFSSPGALAPALDDGSAGRLRTRLPFGRQLGLYRLLSRPRVLLAYTLLQVNPGGACDYLSWSSGLAYRRALPNAELVYLRQAGHNAYQDQPAAYLATVRAFLTGRSLPVPARTTGQIPADYQGPP